MMSQWILFHVELVLSGAGFITIFFLPQLFHFHDPQHFWQIFVLIGLTAGLVAVLAVSAGRRSKRIVRQTTIKQLQSMLQDVATNQLALIQVNTMLARPASEKHVQNVLAAIENLQKALGALSDESLTAWQEKYDTNRQYPIKLESPKLKPIPQRGVLAP